MDRNKVDIEFEKVLTDKTGGNHKFKQSEYLDSGKLPIVDQGAKLIGGYTNEIDKKYSGELPVIVFGDHTKNFKFIDFEFALGADGTKILSVDKEYDPKLIYYYLSTLRLPGKIGYSRHYKYLKENSIPKFDKDYQLFIRDILDKADAIRKKRLKTIRLADELLHSTFLEMFGDPFNNPKGWELKTLPQLVNDEENSIRRGPFGSALKKEIFVNKGYLVYEQYHALNNDFSKQRYFIDEEKYEELKAFKAKPGDLIISCSGVYLGKIAEIPEGAPKGVINQALLKLSLDQTKVVNSYFLFMFSNKGMQKKMFGFNRGSGMPNFPPMTTVNEYKFPIPPPNLQKRFDEIVKKTKSLILNYEESLQETENLFNSLMQKAFRGEL